MRVLVTRPREQAERTAERLVALGHDPFLAPLLTIERTPEPEPPGPFDALLVTSRNAIPPLEASQAIGRGVPLFAVGPRTADLARNAGFTDVREAAGDATSLARLVEGSLRCGARLLHVAGRDRKPEPEAMLRQAGFTVETWVAYEATAAERLPEVLTAALREGALDAALHYSRRSAEILLSLADRALIGPHLPQLWHACLSPDVAAPLEEHGLTRLIVAPRPDEASLLATLALCERSNRSDLPARGASASARTHATRRDPVR